MKSFKELALKHEGKRICIIGGAPSLADDLKKVKADIYISTNGHGLSLQKADYLLAMDETNTHVDLPMGEFLRSLSDAPIISPRSYADYVLTDWPQSPRDILSGMCATWAAMIMGGSVVILAGFDCYGGDEGYIDEALKIARDVDVPVRVFSDALCKVWPKYDGREKFKDYKAPACIKTWLGESAGDVKIEVLKDTEFFGKKLIKGEIIQARLEYLTKLLKHKMVKEVS